MRSAAAATAVGIHSIAPLRLRGEGSAKPGIQLYMVGRELAADAPGTLAKLAAIGYREIEPGGTYAGHSAAEFRKMVEDTGMHCPAGHFPFGMGDTDKLLDDASALGVTYAISSLLPPHPPAGGNWDGFVSMVNGLTRDDFKRMAQMANEIGEKAQKHGIQYAYHNHNIEFRDCGNGETGYSIILKETDAKLVRFEADLGWMATGGADAMALLTATPERFPLLHFKDFDVLKPPVTTLGTERQSQHIVELGQGIVPFKALVAKAKTLHVEHYIVDQDPPFHGKTAFDAAKIDFDYLAGLLA
ncbi:MAG: sugar phosphate isomerase/epimerase [Terracidiphilus sp.]|nr:sugar phosphate isomerase/epimerase [Terracidiphilus sp.]